MKRLMSQRMIQSTERHSKKQNKALEAALITFSDTQVITGISILLAGYIQLPLGISAYHWQVVIALAWFSSLTHLLTLKSLRDYFRERLEMAVWRAVLMGFVMILLVVAIGTTGYIVQADSPDDDAFPAICLFSSDRRLNHAFNYPLIILSIAFITMNYSLKVIGLFTRVPEKFQNWLETKVSKLLKNFFEFASRPRENPRFITIKFRNMLRGLVLLLYVLSKALYEISGSILWEVRTAEENQTYSSS